MKMTLDAEIKDLLFPDCRDNDIKPTKLVKAILLAHYNQIPKDKIYEESKIK
ncbi:hypothetical protein ACWU4D_04360 [Vibrio sp. WJH972]